jgi:hypothetical protein
MGRFFVPTIGVDSWRQLLAQPDLHWKEGRSAWLLAHAWEEADGFPPDVSAVLQSNPDPLLSGLEFVAGFPEYQTPLPGGTRPTQTDLLVLAGNAAGSLVVVGVEGKVDETFGPTVDEWRAKPTPGKMKRLEFLCYRLSLDPADVGDLRYQLLHRTVASMLEAERYGAAAAVTLVHSFSKKAAGFDDFARFGSLLDATAKIDTVATTRLESPPLHIGWTAS